MRRVVLLASVGIAAPAMAAEPTGRWLTPQGRAEVEIATCGGSFCGKIARLAQPIDRNGQPRRDERNTNPALRGRPLVGATLVSDVRPDGADRWRAAVYNPQDGKTYRATLRLEGGELKVEVCAAGGLVCRAQTWTKAD